MAKPRLVTGDVGIALGGEQNAGAAEAGLALDLLVYAFPKAQALDDQRNLARITPCLAHPAPVAARLLAGNLAFLAQCHRDALLRQIEGGTGTDDATADDDDIDARRHLLLWCNRIDDRPHQTISSRVELIGISATLAVFGRSSSMPTRRATSPG